MKKLFSIIVFLELFTCGLNAKIVYLTLPAGSDGDLRYWKTLDGVRDSTTHPFYYLREALEQRGYEIRYMIDNFSIELSDIDQVSAVLSFGETSFQFLLEISALPKEKCLLFVMEPPLIYPPFYEKSLLNFFGKIFMMTDEWVGGKIDGQRYYKWFFPQPYTRIVVDIPEFHHKKFCTLVAGNKNFRHPQDLYTPLYPERRKMIEFFNNSHPDELDLYGTDWSEFTVNRGCIANKFDTLKNYKFCICYENMGNQKGYISEKLIDCLVSGCVPVYLGADNITDFVSRDCFIDRRNFTSDENLYHFLKSIDEETYEQYIQSIRHYLTTPKAHLFSIDHFIHIVLDNI